MTARSSRTDRSADLLPTTTSSSRLYVMYELFYRGFEGVDDDWEWDPELLARPRRRRAGVSS